MRNVTLFKIIISSITYILNALINCYLMMSEYYVMLRQKLINKTIGPISSLRSLDRATLARVKKEIVQGVQLIHAENNKSLDLLSESELETMVSKFSHVYLNSNNHVRAFVLSRLGDQSAYNKADSSKTILFIEKFGVLKEDRQKGIGKTAYLDPDH